MDFVLQTQKIGVAGFKINSGMLGWWLAALKKGKQGFLCVSRNNMLILLCG